MPKLISSRSKPLNRSKTRSKTPRARSYNTVKTKAAPDPSPGSPNALSHALIASGPAHCDTLALHFWTKPPGIAGEIGTLNGRMPFWEPCADAEGEARGILLYVHQPNIQTLRALDEWLLEYQGSISRFDIACELTPTDPSMTIDALVAWIGRNTLLKWRPAGPSLEIGGNFYSVRQSARDDGRKSARDLIVYKRPSKISRSANLEICQWEIRFQRADAAKREHILLPSQLIDLNPQRLIDKHIKLVDMDGYIASSIRASIQDERQRYQERHQMQGLSTSLTDAYRASLPRRMASIWQRGCQCRAQTFKDNQPMAARRLKTRPGSILIPDHLSWPDGLQEAGIDNEVEFLRSPSTYRIDMDEAD